MVGFYKACFDNILIGGTNISKLDDESLLQYYFIIFQDVLLFDGTIMDNIWLGNENVTDYEVRETAKLANCNSFISYLPNENINSESNN